MEDFNIRSDSVDVEAIMQRIRERIRDKRGVDYTEEEIRTIAHARLETFLDPGSVRSDLVEHYQRLQPERAPNYAFEDTTIYDSSHSIVGRLIALARRLLNPVLKLFFNPNPIIHVLHMQSEINDHVAKQMEMDILKYEVLNNLVVETTRLGIEVKNLKMRVESLSSRLDFDERRARALEGVVEYRPSAVPAPTEMATGRERSEDQSQPAGEEPRARRRRRRGRRRGPARGKVEAGESATEAPEEAPIDSGEVAPPATATETGQREP